MEFHLVNTQKLFTDETIKVVKSYDNPLCGIQASFAFLQGTEGMSTHSSHKQEAQGLVVCRGIPLF